MYIYLIWFSCQPQEAEFVIIPFYRQALRSSKDLMICLVQDQAGGKLEQWNLNSKAVLLY